MVSVTKVCIKTFLPPLREMNLVNRSSAQPVRPFTWNSITPVSFYTFQPGDAIYEDINHDGNINYQILCISVTATLNSPVVWCLVTYKAQKLTVFFNYRYKFDLINGTQINTTNMYGFDGQSTAVPNGKEGDETDIPRGHVPYRLQLAGRPLREDASFLRFRTIRLPFIPHLKLLQKSWRSKPGAYSNGRKPVLWTNYTGQDRKLPYVW